MDHQTVEKWGIYELTYGGQMAGNPFTDADITADFISEGRKMTVRGFYNGNDEYKIRFMPDATGVWKYQVHSNINEINGREGAFVCEAPSEGNHGPVRVVDRYHFAYEDGTPYHPVGTTCYVWNHQTDTLEQETLKTLEKSAFNKMRMCVFPKHYLFNENEPRWYPFEGNIEEGWDFTRFNPEYFAHLEQCIEELMRRGIEADLILFHEYDRWGFAHMPADADDRYLGYITARLSAYRNIWWSLANEYDLMTEKDTADWDRFFGIIKRYDPYGHLRSIHNCHELYDHGKEWVTHCSIQHSDLALTSQWLETYKKPVVVDECCYEGDISPNWGNITARELVHRMWEAYGRGGYAGHGETYLDSDDILWWSKGGRLRGQSPERIKFLRTIMEQAPGYLIPTELGKDIKSAVGFEDQYYICYIGNRQPRGKRISLPEGKKYRAEVLDGWNMTVTPLMETYEGVCEIALPGLPYQAIRLYAVE